MPYVQLAIAIACEIGASSALKATHGFTVLAPSVATIVLYGLSFYLFSLVLNVLDLASAYATWCAAGIVATSVISVLVFGDRLSPMMLVGLGLCVIVGRRVSAPFMQLKNAGRTGRFPCDRRFVCISSILPACDLCCTGVNAQRHPCFKTLR